MQSLHDDDNLSRLKTIIGVVPEPYVHVELRQCTPNKLCAWRHNMPRPSPLPVGAQVPRAPPSRRNVAVLSHAEYVPTLTDAAALRVKAALSKAAWWPWPFDLESGIRVTCDVGYLCANFSLPGPLCSRVRPDVRDRQTNVRQTSDKSIA